LNENEQEPQLTQFDRTQFCYLNLSCIFVLLALVALIANPIWGSLFALLFLILTVGLLRACFKHEVKADDYSSAST
jgi:hypothetical protein